MRPRFRKPMLYRLVSAVTLITGVCTPASAGDSQSSVISAVDSASTTVTLGDPVLFSLTLRYQADQRPDRVSLPSFDVDVDVTELAPTPARAIGDGLFETVLSWELRFFELGDHQIPPIEVVLVSRAAGTEESLRSAPVAVSVGSVRENAESEELVDIKPPVVIPGGVPLWLAVVALTLILAIVVALLCWLLRGRRRSSGAARVPPKPTDYIVEFKKIARMGLVERRAFLVYYTLLSQTLRRYLEDRVGVDAMERTTEEVAEALQGDSIVDSAQVGRIMEFLSQADLVKFACAEPMAEDARHAPEIGQQIVHAVDALVAAEQEEVAAREKALHDGMKSESGSMELPRTTPS